MIVKVLVENTAADNLTAEHGLCLYVEYNNRSYLIDSGASEIFAGNAEKMSVDLDKVDKAFLSHAHYDHSGGYPAFFERNNHAKVYLQKAAGNRDCCKIVGSEEKYIGIPKGLLKEYEDRFEFVEGEAKIDEGIYIVPHTSDGILERAKHTHMCVKIGDKAEYDDFSHEQTVVFEEKDGLVCFNSCSHSGVDIIVDEVRRSFPDKKIKAYIGGFHMMGVTGASSCGYTKEEVEEVAAKLIAASETKFYSGHCTGSIAYEWLEDVMKDRLIALATGKTFEI